MSAACPHYLQERTSAPPNKSVALLIYVMSLMFENGGISNNRILATA
jgi:hypothetical protein